MRLSYPRSSPGALRLAAAEQSEEPISIATFTGRTDTTPVAKSLTWPQLSQVLTRHTRRAVKDGPLWSPTLYRDGASRRNDGVEAITAGVLDLDHLAPGAIDEILKRLDGYRWVAHTTHSHTPAAPRWRLVLPFSAPAPAADWPDVWGRLAALIPEADPARKDLSGMYYWPSCPPDATPEARPSDGGDLLDPYSLPPVERPAPRPVATPSRHETGDRAIALFSAWADRLDTAAGGENDRGGRNRALYALMAEGLGRGLPEPDVEAVARDYCRRAGLYDGGDEERAAKRTIRSAIERHQQQPFTGHEPARQETIRVDTTTHTDAPDGDESTLARLAAMSPVQYDRVRASEADRLGIRVSTLDAEVVRLRARVAEATERPSLWPAVEPWPEEVDGAELLRDLYATARRYMVMSDHAALAVALWTVHTYALDAADVTPILGITSPEKRCGKSTLLDMLTRIVSRPLAAANISPSAVFRTIEAWRPTLLIDEADTALPGHDELRGILNSGHSRGSAYVIRSEETPEGGYEPRIFTTWAVKAIALIGRLPGTIHDRAIEIRLARRLRGEKVERLRHADPEIFTALARQCLRWAADHLDRLRAARPALPEALNDRAADNWEALLAIADLAGGEWPGRARDAALALSGVEVAAEADSTAIRLLRDIRSIMGTCDHIPTATLIASLVAIEEAPWGEICRGRPITPRRLASMLRQYGVTPGTIRISPGSDGTLKGYTAASLAEAWSRYLPSDPPADPPHPSHADRERIPADFSSVTEEACGGYDHGLGSAPQADVADVTDGEGDPWEEIA